MDLDAHFETIICPKCKGVELAEVEHTFPYWSYVHVCRKCSETIGESEWDSTGHFWHSNMEDIVYTMKPSSVDIVITDPPFGVRKEFDWDDREHFIKQMDIWLMELLRVSKHAVIMFGASKMTPYLMAPLNRRNLEHYYFRHHFWEKPPGSQYNGASNNGIWYSSETIYVFTKDRKKTASYGDDVVKMATDNLSYRNLKKADTGHPTAKPVPLMAKLIQHYTREGETVLDPFAGSFSTAKGCIKTNRKFITIERSPTPDKPVTDEDGDNPDYFGRGMNAIKQINSELDFFLSKDDKEPTKLTKPENSNLFED